MELRGRLRKCGEKSMTLSFNPQAKKELFHSYQYRLGVEGRGGGKDVGWALPLPGKAQGTEDIKVKATETGRPERRSQEAGTKIWLIDDIFKDEEQSEFGKMKIWKKALKEGLRTKVDHAWATK